MDQLCVTLGGRTSEELFYSFDEITTGASNDLEKVTQLAHACVTKYGLDDTLGPISLSNGTNSLGMEEKKYSEATAQLIDTQVKALIEKAHDRTKNLLALHKEKVQKLAETLLLKESVNHEDLVSLLGPRPAFARAHTYESFLKEQARSRQVDTEREKQI